jgi:hypothetical protein
MKGDQPTITAEQRKALADLLKANSVARARALSALHDAESELRRTLIDEEAKKCGALELAREITDLEKRKDDQEQTLQALGFNVGSDGELILRYDAPRALRQSIDERVRKELGSEREIEQQYDRALTKVLTANSADEAAKIVESLL